MTELEQAAADFRAASNACVAASNALKENLEKHDALQKASIDAWEVASKAKYRLLALAGGFPNV